jgi:hypothetical protein
MKYDFRLLPEALRAGTFAAIVFGLQLLVRFNVEDVAVDWETWATSGASGIVAASAAAGLAVLTRK